MSDLINQPDAHRLISGLRDTGYNFNTAAADIIDNSIAANATEVNVRIELAHDGRKFVYFGDNGDGMDGKTLFKAMRYGAPPRSSLASLGKFGLGLKTASSSVCKKYTVVTRQSGAEPLIKLAWDLDHVEDQNQWEMLREPVTSDEEDMFAELCGEKGTLVVWAKCDRLLSKEYIDAGGSKEQQAVKRLGERLTEHIALIYHRFLEAPGFNDRVVRITVNGAAVKGWNPFFTEKAQQALAPKFQTLEVQHEDGSIDKATIRAWLLPNSRDLTEADKKKARITNHGQGFYIHREGRIIQCGGWLGVFGNVEPHFSTLRVEFDFDHKLDDAFKVDVKKSRILFDPALEEHLRDILAPIYREAGNRARKRDQAAIVENGIDHSSANKVIEGTPNAAGAQVVSVDADKKVATLSNRSGPTIKLRVPIETNVKPGSVFVDAVDDIRTGHLWEPSVRSTAESGFVTGVKLNKHHEFYQKIYQRAGSSGHAVEGMDLLLWAFAKAEHNYTNPELQIIFEDMRAEISANLHKLLRDLPLPDEEDLAPRNDEE
jgi:hypothetical protein